MAKQRGPGGKGRRKAKAVSAKSNELLFADTYSSYAYVKENNGSGHFRVLCTDGLERMGVLRGSMRKRVWVRRGDIVLVTLREFEDSKADIVHKYNATEVSRLANMNEVPESLMKFYIALDGEEVEDSAELDYFAFADDDETIDAI
jgi:translation initiation factor 1A